MNPIITFFRDILDGTTYVIVCSISAVLLCACIGYLAEKKSKTKEQTSTITPQANAPSTIAESMVAPQPIPEQNSNLMGRVNPIDNAIAQPMPIEQPATTESPVVSQEQQVSPAVSTVAPTQITQTPTPEQPIFPPVDNGVTSSSVVNTSQPGETSTSAMPVSQEQTSIGEQPVMPEVAASDQSIFPPVEKSVSVPPIDNTVPTMEAANLDVPQTSDIMQQPEEAVETISDQTSQEENTTLNNQATQTLQTPEIGEQPVMPQINTETTPLEQAPVENLQQ